MRMNRAIPWRFTAQSKAESPPPTSSTRFPVNTLGSRMRSCRPFPYQRSASLRGSFRGVKAPIPPAMSTLRDGYSSRAATIGTRGWPSGESCFRSITFSPKWTGCLNWKAEQAFQFKPPVHLGEKVVDLKHDSPDGQPRVTTVTDRDHEPSGSVLVAGGMWAVDPR